MKILRHLLTLSAECTSLTRWAMFELREWTREVHQRLMVVRRAKWVALVAADHTCIWSVNSEESDAQCITVPRVSSDGGDEALEEAAWRGQAAVGALPEEQVLVHEIEYPAVVEAELSSVMHLWIEREMPLAVREVLCNWEVVRRDSASRSIVVRVLAVRRSVAASAVERLISIGLRPVRLGYSRRMSGSDDSEVAGNFLLELQRKEQTGKSITGLSRNLPKLAAVALSAVVTTWLGYSGYEWMVMRTPIAEARAASRAHDKLSADLRKRAVPIESLAAVTRQADAGDVVLYLTAQVPTDSWFFDLSVESGKDKMLLIKASGYTPRANQLIKILEGMKSLHGVTITNAQPAGVGTDRDRVQFTANWVSVDAG